LAARTAKRVNFGNTWRGFSRVSEQFYTYAEERPRSSSVLSGECPKKSQPISLGWSSGALGDLFIEYRERAADAAHFGHDHSRIYLCGAGRIIVFWHGGLWRALTHSLKADRTSDEPAKFSTISALQKWRSTSNCHSLLSTFIVPWRSHVCAMVVQKVLAITDAPSRSWQRARVSGIAAQGPLCPCVTNALTNTRRGPRFAQAALKSCG
jgi:hypothetical protein